MTKNLRAETELSRKHAIHEKVRNVSNLILILKVLDYCYLELGQIEPVKGGGEMVEVIMVIAIMYFLIGLSFNYVLMIAVNELRKVRKEWADE